MRHMPSNFKPDPYDGFNDDVERRRALNVRAVCKAVAVVVVALASTPSAFLSSAAQWVHTLLR